MSKIQRIILIVGTFFVALMLLIPPWKYLYTGEREKVERSAGYYLVFAPPSLKDHERIRGAFSFPKTKTEMRYPQAMVFNTAAPVSNPEPITVPYEINERAFQLRIDTMRLLVQCAFALLLTVGLAIAFYRH